MTENSPQNRALSEEAQQDLVAPLMQAHVIQQEMSGNYSR